MKYIVLASLIFLTACVEENSDQTSDMTTICLDGVAYWIGAADTNFQMMSPRIDPETLTFVLCKLNQKLFRLKNVVYKIHSITSWVKNMQTFFITYNTGEYDSYSEHVYAIDAISKDEITKELEKAVDEFIIHRNNRKTFDSMYRPIGKMCDTTQWKEYYTKVDEFIREHGYTPPFKIYNDINLYPFDEIMESGKETAILNSCLEIYTIEEYIEKCKPVRK